MSFNRRRFLRFSTRALLFAMALAVIPLSWLTRRMIAARDQAEAVRALVEKGVYIGFAHQWDHVNDRFSDAGPPGPVILREALGEHFFLVPDTVIVNGAEDASALKPLARLSSVARVAICDTSIGDEAISFIENLGNLEELTFAGTPVTDTGVQRLAKLPRLKRLALSKTAVTESGLQAFRSQRPDCVVYLDKNGEAFVDP